MENFIILILNIIATYLNIIIRFIDMFRSKKSTACISDEDQEIVEIEALKNIIITNANNNKQSVRQGQTAKMPKTAALKMEKKGRVKILQLDFNKILAMF